MLAGALAVAVFLFKRRQSLKPVKNLQDHLANSEQPCQEVEMGKVEEAKGEANRQMI